MPLNANPVCAGLTFIPTFIGLVYPGNILKLVLLVASYTILDLACTAISVPPINCLTIVCLIPLVSVISLTSSPESC